MQSGESLTMLSGLFKDDLSMIACFLEDTLLNNFIIFKKFYRNPPDIVGKVILDPVCNKI
jgi:hypothetical protein